MIPDKIWLSSPHMRDKEQELVNNAFATNWIAPLGPHVNGFEEDIQKFSGVHTAALSSGTAAIHLALILSNVGPGDLVFVPSMTFSATINPVIYQGAIPVFIDSEPGTWNMSPVHFENALKSVLSGTLKPELQNPKLAHFRDSDRKLKPKCVLPVHLYGMPAKLNAILKIARRYNLTVIEDAAESLGSTYEGRQTGSFGKMGIYSFNGNKIITTSGGGALVSNDESLVKKARHLATQARDPAPHYEHSEIGYNYRLSNVLAGIGRGQMEVLPEHIEKRRANYKRYRKYFGKWNERGFNIRFQREQEESRSNRWLTCILIDPEKNRGLTREELRLGLAANNIEARPLWKPMHLQPVFEGYPYYGDGTSERLFDMGLCLPSGSNLTEEDFARIFSSLDKIFEDKLDKTIIKRGDTGQPVRVQQSGL